MKHVRTSGVMSRLNRLKLGEVQSVLAYAASFMLTGVPPSVCESVLSEFYCSVRRSLHTILS
jgi:hypothetical protein